MEHEEMISTGVADIASSMGLGEQKDDLEVVDTPETPEVEAITTGNEEAPPVEAPVVRNPPSSWAKDYHEHWGKLDPKVQDYIETREKQMLDGLGQYKEYHSIGKGMKEVITPYMPMIQAAGIEPEKAVASLLNAHYQLTQGSPEQRYAAYQRLGQDLGFVQQQNMQQLPPEVRAMQEQLQQLQGALTSRQQADLKAKQDQTAKEVESFAKDSPYLDEVADEMVAFINAGADLKTAYDKAIYANPVTRQKELQRLQTEAEKALKAKAGKAVVEAKRSTAANVRSRDTARTPTEALGKMEDTMKETLREINSRTH